MKITSDSEPGIKIRTQRHHTTPEPTVVSPVNNVLPGSYAFKEDDCTAYTRYAPSNSAIINTIATAVIRGDNRKIGKPNRSFVESLRAFSYRRKDILKVLFTPF